MNTEYLVAAALGMFVTAMCQAIWSAVRPRPPVAEDPPPKLCTYEITTVEGEVLKVDGHWLCRVSNTGGWMNVTVEEGNKTRTVLAVPAGNILHVRRVGLAAAHVA